MQVEFYGNMRYNRIMKDIISLSAMTLADKKTIESGTPARELMLRAAKAIYGAKEDIGRAAVVCGKGNNAGDGYALAMLAHADGKDVTLIRLCGDFSEDGRYYYDICRENNVPELSADADLSGFDTVYDCIFGTGFSGEPSGIYSDAIRKINASGAFVISADIPSGLNGNTGLASLCVKSDITVAIGYIKTGEILNMAKDHVGALICADIGIKTDDISAKRFEAEDCSAVIKERKNHCHKGDFGYVSIIGGCADYIGAPKLANLGMTALRAGCGVSRLCVPESLALAVSPMILESTLVRMPERDGYMMFSEEALDRALSGTRAAAVGMGWGKGEDNAKILSYILRNYTGTLIIDADALNTISQTDKTCLKNKSCRVVITPHPKEFERLSGIPTAQVIKEPIRYAREFALEYGVTVLLKGTASVITDGNECYLCDCGCAGMATAGSGDVLSGVLAGLFGYSEMSLPYTAACGAYIAGRAGEIAQKKINAVSMTSSDTAAHIPDAISEIIDNKNTAE